MLFRLLSVAPLAVTAEYTFLALGDWGGDSDDSPTSPTQLETEKGLAAVAEQLDSQFFFGLGDNFYTSGLNENNLDRIQSTWENVYTDASLQKEWWLIAGNHDHRGEVQYQIDYDGTGNWHYPAEYYTFSKTTPEGKVAQFVVFDSITIAGMSWYDKDTHTFHGATGPKNVTAAAVQLEWFEQQLSQSAADFLFTVAHYPYLSPCDHGPQMEWFRDMLAKYKVTAHLAGHDHCLAHSEHEGVHHVLSGAGADNWYEATSFGELPENADVKWYVADDNKGSHIGGFVAVTMDADAARFRYYNEKAELLYESDPQPARVYTPYTGTSTTTTFIPDTSECREWEWPDVKNDQICGVCTVLVDKWDSRYRNCHGYCRSMGRACVAAWEESHDDCGVKYDMTCDQTLDTSDAICRCSGTEYTGTTTSTTTKERIPDTTPCDEASWPDKDHDLVCGTCKVLVDHFDSLYKNCDGYCHAINRYCVGAWEELDDTCDIDDRYAMDCSTTLDSADAICECSSAATVTV